MNAVMKRSSASVAASWSLTCRNAVARSAPRRNAIRSIACICVTDSAGAMPWPVASPSTTTSPRSVGIMSKVSPPVCSAGRDVPKTSYPGMTGIADGSVLICTSRANSSSWRRRSPSISASVMRTRCSATAHWAASAAASVSSPVSKTPPALFSTCITPTSAPRWSIRGSVSMQRVR